MCENHKNSIDLETGKISTFAVGLYFPSIVSRLTSLGVSLIHKVCGIHIKQVNSNLLISEFSY